MRIPIEADGSAGPVETRATGLDGIDDFAFAGKGETVLAALNSTSEVAVVRRDGSHTVLLTAADGAPPTAPRTTRTCCSPAWRSTAPKP
ncbi:hypothetical protein ACFYRL_19880 [Streptomyces goshikiensis]|uniref:hypothetical protein n=1 Tax=Streptomyces goshikiensis TaxID=1942 RepID=UPI0036BE7F9B